MATHTTSPTTVLVGGESAGKSTLAATLTGRRPHAENVPGSTLDVQRFAGRDQTYLDTPGLVHRLDAVTTRATLDALHAADDAVVLLVLRATHLDDELAELLPLVAGRRGVVAVTHWDRVADTPVAHRALAGLAAATGVPFVPVDGRDAATRPAIEAALGQPGTFAAGPILARAGWRVEPPRTLLDHRWLGPPAGLALLLGPSVGAVWAAVAAADVIEPYVEALLAPAATAAARLPTPFAETVAGEYGLLTMGPLLLVWALPVVLVLALLLGLGKASGLLDRCTTAVHPLVRPLGLTGRDLVRVVAGYGCNVPAVISTRSCSSCSREPTVGAIAFGSACSFQLAATLGVLAAAQRPGLALPYVLVLVAGALVHARLLARRDATPAGLDLALLRGRAFLTRPRWRDVRREATTTLEHVTLRALPVFLGIVVLASLLSAYGVIEAAARPLGPVLAALRLPGEVALPVLLASLRKDGLLLLAEPGTVAALDDAQLLATLVLAGALLPCLVTALTIARELSRSAALRLIGRQVAGALLLTAAVSWIGLLVVTA